MPFAGAIAVLYLLCVWRVRVEEANNGTVGIERKRGRKRDMLGSERAAYVLNSFAMFYLRRYMKCMDGGGGGG